MADPLSLIAQELPARGQHGTLAWEVGWGVEETICVLRQTDGRSRLVAAFYGPDRYEYLARLLATEPEP